MKTTLNRRYALDFLIQAQIAARTIECRFGRANTGTLQQVEGRLYRFLMPVRLARRAHPRILRAGYDGDHALPSTRGSLARGSTWIFVVSPSHKSLVHALKNFWSSRLYCPPGQPFGRALWAFITKP